MMIIRGMWIRIWIWIWIWTWIPYFDCDSRIQAASLAERRDASLCCILYGLGAITVSFKYCPPPLSLLASHQTPHGNWIGLLLLLYIILWLLTADSRPGKSWVRTQFQFLKLSKGFKRIFIGFLHTSGINQSLFHILFNKVWMDNQETGIALSNDINQATFSHQSGIHHYIIIVHKSLRSN